MNARVKAAFAEVVNEHFPRATYEGNKADPWFPAPRRVTPQELVQMLDYIPPGRDLGGPRVNATPLPPPKKPPRTGTIVVKQTVPGPGRGKTQRRLVRLWEMDKGRCHLCGGAVPHPNFNVSGPTGPSRPTADHMIPRSAGGSSGLPNLRLAHAWCNSLRSNLPITPDLGDWVRKCARERFGRVLGEQRDTKK